MSLSRVMTSLVMVFTVGGCELFLTGDSENAPGRGPRAFDPYVGPASGAIRLGLQMLNGCAIYATGEPVGSGNANIPYPTDCGHYQYQNPVNPSAPPPTPLPLLAGTTYFLNQITIHELAENLHTDPTNLAAISDWMRTQTRLASLDWTNLTIVADEWEPSNESISPYAFTRIVRWGNANWMNVTDDSFQLEVLDADGMVRNSVLYSRQDFFAENPIAEHTNAFWEEGNVGAPQFPGDLVVHPKPPAPPGYPPPVPASFRSHVRFEVIGAARTPKTFQIDPGLIGDGAIRITWSQLPFQPFYWPVRFVKPADLPPTCFKAGDPSQPVPCGFGLVPLATLSPPANGVYYTPGENYQLTLGAQDGNGNYLHPSDHFPSWNEYNTQHANGLLYINFFNFYVMRERDTISGFNIAGPRQNMRPYYELASAPYYIKPTEEFVPGDTNEGITPITGPNVAENLTVGARDAHQPTTFNLTIPPDAKPGTYAVYWKVNRQFMGERFTKLAAFDFQVGQAQVTNYPGRVGNCQICHRGVISLENVRHGLAVDDIEGCKACHNRDTFPDPRGNSWNRIHQVHMSSAKYPQPKNDCTICHLTRESTLRPSYVVCASCHPRPHGDQYNYLPITTDYDPRNTNTVYGNCAQMCHQQTPPTGHILPAE